MPVLFRLSCLSPLLSRKQASLLWTLLLPGLQDGGSLKACMSYWSGSKQLLRGSTSAFLPAVTVDVGHSLEAVATVTVTVAVVAAVGEGAGRGTHEGAGGQGCDEQLLRRQTHDAFTRSRTFPVH